MDARIKKLWVAALRSGEYKQGKGRLRRPLPGSEFEFCCLGVLCDLHAKETRQGEWLNGGYKVPDFGSSSAYTLPPIEVYRWAGIGVQVDMHDTLFLIDGLRAGLDTHNDSGATFEQIAKAIEEQA